MHHYKDTWYALYTKPWNEDVVAFRLEDAGIEVLNPKIRLKKFHHNKFTEIIEPLFPCYLFANFNKDSYSHLISYTRGVRYIVGKSNPVVVPEEIIKTIKEKMEERNVIVIKPQRFETGDRVIIKEGLFKDFYGIFERETRGSERAMILLNTIYYRLEIDSCLLIKV